MDNLKISLHTKKNTVNILFVTVVSILLLTYFILKESPKQLLHALKDANNYFLFTAFFCMGIYWLLEAISLYMIAHKPSPAFAWRQALQTSMLGQLFNCITPFASGGQPMQAYSMVKYNIPLGTASSILLAKFIVYQTTLTIYSLLILLLKFSFFSDKVSNLRFLVFAGFLANTTVVATLLSICFFPAFTKITFLWIIRLLAKVKLVKNVHKTTSEVLREINNFYQSFSLLKHNMSVFFITSLVVVLQLTTLFLIPYFICLSLGISNVSMENIVSAGAFVLMISSFIPLPGASGGAEGSFYLFFSYFFQKTGNIGLAILLWRIITFYLTILMGALFSKRIRQSS